MNQPTEQALPRPLGICPWCQHNGAVRVHEPAGEVSFYCEHNRAGAMLQRSIDGQPVWTIFTPVTEVEFDSSVHAHLLRKSQALSVDSAAAAASGLMN